MDSNIAKVNITVTPNRPPVANDDLFATGEDTVLSGTSNLPAGVTVKQWAGNGNYYAYVTTQTRWGNAKVAASNLVYRGVSGHLATI